MCQGKHAQDEQTGEMEHVKLIQQNPGPQRRLDQQQVEDKQDLNRKQQQGRQVEENLEGGVTLQEPFRMGEAQTEVEKQRWQE